MRIERISALLIILAGLQVTPAWTDQASAQQESPAISAAGREVLSKAPRLLPPSDSTGELRRILSQAEYQEAPGKQPQESWLNRIWEQLQELLGGFGVGGSGLWGVLLAVLLLALLVFLVARLLWQWATRARFAQPAAEGTGQPQTVDQLLAAAHLAAGQGDFRAAIRFRYLALLRALNLPTAAVMTNSQISRRMSQRHPALQGALGELIVSYEDCWYGGAAVQRREYETAVRLARSIEDGISERSEDERANQ